MSIMEASKLVDDYGDVVAKAMKCRPEFSAKWYAEHPELARTGHPAVCGMVQRGIARQHNKRLLADAIRLVDRGHYHNDVRDCLANILTAMKLAAAAELTQQLPDRLTWDTCTEYAFALLHLFIQAECDSMMEGRCHTCPQPEETTP